MLRSFHTSDVWELGFVGLKMEHPTVQPGPTIRYNMTQGPIFLWTKTLYNVYKEMVQNMF